MVAETTFRANLKYVFLLAFSYSVVVAFTIQLVLLPYIFPDLDSGNGLLKHHDWVSYHRLAAEMAARIHEQGWGQWELRVYGWIEPGLVAVVYYFTVAKPWALIPINALIHASTAIVILLILRPFLDQTRRSSVLAAAPFVFFPTSLLWVAQIHKDGIAFFSCLLFVLAMIKMSSPFSGPSKAKYFWTGMVFCLIGSITGWIIRPYLGDLFILQLFLLSLAVSIRVLSSPARFFIQKGLIASWLAIWVLTFSLRPILNLGTYQSTPPPAPPEVIAESGGRGFDTPVVPPPLNGAETAAPLAGETIVPSVKPSEDISLRAEGWTYTRYLPKVIDEKLYAISRIREGYANTLSSTNVDSQVKLQSFAEFVAYLPRALQIALVYPNPFSKSFWNQGNVQESSAQKKLVRLEMFAIYLLLPICLFQFVRFRKRFDVYILLFSCLITVVIYTYTVTNMGTLHRFRYGFIALLLGFGTTGIPGLLQYFRERTYRVRNSGICTESV